MKRLSVMAADIKSLWAAEKPGAMLNQEQQRIKQMLI